MWEYPRGSLVVQLLGQLSSDITSGEDGDSNNMAGLHIPPQDTQEGAGQGHQRADADKNGHGGAEG